MYNVWFDVCAICVLVVLLLVAHIKNKIPITQNHIFTLLTVLVLISTVCDFAGGLWNNYHDQWGFVPLFVPGIINFLYFLTRNATAFVYVTYIITVLGLEWKSGKQLAALFLPFAVDLAVILPTPFFHWAFHLDETGGYHRGPFLPILYAMAAFYLLLAVYLVIRYRAFIPAARQLSFHSFLALALGTICIQAFFPTIMVEGFGTTLCILLIYLTIQRPEEVLDGSSGLLNKTAFLTMLSLKFKQKTKFQVLTLIITEVTSLEKTLSANLITHISAAIGQWMRQNIKGCTLYHITDGQFCIISKYYDPARMDAVTQAIMERFSRSWEIRGLHISLPSNILRIDCPGSADTVEHVIDLIETAVSNSPRPCPAVLQPEELKMVERQRRREIRQIVAHALEKDWLEVYYQPIYSVGDGRFTAAEALLRLRHPNLGFIPPDEFIPIAEESGAIVPIGRFVLDRVCRCLSRYRLPELGIKYIEVNLSVVECLQNDLADTVLQTLERHGLLPSQINLEITETAMSAIPDTVIENLDRLAKRGVRFSLDDYGTGYSNLTRLLHMPLSLIKLDRTLVQTLFLDASKEAHVVLDSTFRMLRRLGKQSVAEGVETADQAKRLIAMDCEFIQGFHYAKPMPEESFIAFLSQAQGTEKDASQPGVC